MKRIGRFSLLITLFLMSFKALAAVQVEAVVDRNRMNQGDALVLTISVRSDQSVNVQEPRLPGLDGFQLINKWSGSEAASTFSNGKFETIRTQKFNYQLTAPRKGQFTIGQVEVVVNGEPKKTKPIKVQVLAGGAPKPNRVNPRDPFKNDPFFNNQMAEVDDLFNQLLGRKNNPRLRRPNQPRPNGQQQQQPNVAPQSDVAIEVVVDKSKVYAGEQVTATWYLYTQGQVRDIDTLKYPSLNGFWKEDIEIATHLNFRRQIINGVAYRRALLASYALFPIKPGPINIDPYEAKITAITSNSMLGFGLGRPQTVVKKSQMIPIEVMPLPPGKPADFVGAVGNYRVTATLDQPTITVNQPVTLRIRFNGRGNAKLIEMPKVEFPKGLELYDTKTTAKFRKDGTSQKDFEVLLIPREPGQFQIPGMSMSYFNPQTKQYERRSTAAMAIQVYPSKGDEMIPSSPIAEEVKEPEQPKDLLPAEVLAWSPGGSSPLFENRWVWLAGFMLAAMGLLFKARQEFGWGQKLKSLSQIVHRRFSKIADLANKGLWREVGVETTNAVYFILGEISGEGGANVEIEKLILKAPPSVRRELGESIEKLMDQFQILSFAPEEVVGPLKQKENLVSAVKEMEKVMLKAVALGVNAENEEIPMTEAT